MEQGKVRVQGPGKWIGQDEASPWIDASIVDDIVRKVVKGESKSGICEQVLIDFVKAVRREGERADLAKQGFMDLYCDYLHALDNDCRRRFRLAVAQLEAAISGIDKLTGDLLLPEGEGGDTEEE